MKKSLKFGLLTAAFALTVGSGVLVARSNKSMAKAEAASGAVALVPSNLTCTKTVYYEKSNGSGDVTSLAVNNMTTTAYSGARNTQSTGTGNLVVGMGETSSSKNWHGMYKEYSFEVSLPAYSDVTVYYTVTVSTYKNSSSGQANHAAEFMSHGTALGTFTLQCANADNYSGNITISNQGQFAAVRANDQHGANGGNGTLDTYTQSNKTVTCTSSNYYSTTATKTFYFALFSFVETSGTAHTHQADFNVSINTDITSYDARYQLTGNSDYTYGNFTTCFNNVNANANGGTVQLLRNVALTAGYATQKNTTIDLNGFNLTRDGSGSDPYACIFNILYGSTLTITSTSKTAPKGTLSSNYAKIIINISANDNGNAGTLNVNGGATIQISWPGPTYSGHAIVADGAGATVNLESCYIKTASSPTNLTTSGVLVRKGSTVNVGDGTNFYGHADSYAVRSDNTTANQDTLNFSGTVYFHQGRVGIQNVSAARINLYKGSTPFSSTSDKKMRIDVRGGGLTYGTTVAYALSTATNYLTAGYISLVSNVESYLTFIKSGNNYIIGYRAYSFTYYLSHISKTANDKAYHSDDFIISLTPESEYYALPNGVTISRGSTHLTAGTDYQYVRDIGKLTIYKEAFVGTDNFTIYAYADLTDLGKVNDWVSQKMYMTTYTENNGRCLDSSPYHYYSLAKTALLALGEDCIDILKTESRFANAKARYEAWARANHDAHPYENIAYSGINITNQAGVNGSNYYVIVVVSVAIGGIALLYLKSRKREN